MPATPAPANMPMRFRGIPASRIITKNVPENSIVEPKSGCAISKAPMSPIRQKQIATTGMLGSRARQESIHASRIGKPVPRNCEGWREMPKCSQRLAPFTSEPTTGTSSKPKIIMPAIRMPSRRALSFDRLDAQNIAQRPTNCQRKCSQKK